MSFIATGWIFANQFAPNKIGWLISFALCVAFLLALVLDFLILFVCINLLVGRARRVIRKIAKHIKFSTWFAIVVGSFLIVAVINNGEFSKKSLGEVAGFINLVAYLPYFVSILKGETKPSKTTWWIWTILEVMMSTSYVMSGAESTMWLPIASGIGMLLTAILSLKFGDEHHHQVDHIFIICSLIGLDIWILSGSSLVGLIAFLAVDLFAAIPTLFKAWDDPFEEDLFAWIITLISGLINLFALENMSFSIAILPVYNLAIYLAVVLFLKIGRRYNSSTISQNSSGVFSEFDNTPI